MEIGLDEPAGERRDDREHERGADSPSDPERSHRRDERAPFQQRAFAHGNGSKPADCDREGGPERERDERQHRQGGPTRPVLEQSRGRARREGIGDGAREQDDQRSSTGPAHGSERATAHRTFSVKGAVRTWPSTLHCRKSRHVPGTGSRTPTRSCPGRVALPVTRVGPSTLVQPVIPA